MDTYLHQVLGTILCQCWYEIVIYGKCNVINLYLLTIDIKTVHCDIHLAAITVYKLNTHISCTVATFKL